MIEAQYFTYNKLVQSSHMTFKKKKRHIFTPEEDERLKRLVADKGVYKWEEISLEMNGLNARQCRDRWTYYLNPNVISKPWTKEEETRLLQLVQIMGNCWVQIARRFKGRTDIQIKNKYNSLIQKIDSKKFNPFYQMNYFTNNQINNNTCNNINTQTTIQDMANTQNWQITNFQNQSIQSTEYNQQITTSPPPVSIACTNSVFEGDMFEQSEESIFGIDFNEALKLFA